MRAPDQYVSRHVVKQCVGFEAPPVLVHLSRIAVAQLRIVGFKVSAYFLARLLEADGAVGFGDATSSIHRYQDVEFMVEQAYYDEAILPLKEPGELVPGFGAEVDTEEVTAD